jgi:hypothetical protein
MLSSPATMPRPERTGETMTGRDQPGVSITKSSF